MTENKRFERIYEDVDVFCRDHNAEGISQLIEKEDYDKIVDLLNELHYENEELDTRINNLEEDLQYYKSKCGSLETGLFQADREKSKLQKENKELKIENELLSDELEQCKAVINKKWSEYLKKKELSE